MEVIAVVPTSEAALNNMARFVLTNCKSLFILACFFHRRHHLRLNWREWPACVSYFPAASRISQRSIKHAFALKLCQLFGIMRGLFAILGRTRAEREIEAIRKF